MAITEQTPQHDYTATSGQTEFIFTFTLFDSLDAIKVFVEGVEQVRNTDYSVYASDGSNILTTDFPLSGGKVVFNTGLTAGDLVALVRDTTISRSTDYNNNSSFDADTFDESLDKSMAIMQDQNRRLAAKIGAAEGDAVADLTLPSQAERAGKVLAFDTNGNMIASAGGNVAVTAFMAQVLDDADASTARETLDVVQAIPGEVILVANNSVPSGFLECNGALLNRITYAALFAAIGTTYGTGDGTTTFGIPDLRGEFIRGWDNSKGVDTNRAIGSNQTDDIKSHRHELAQSSLGYVAGSGASNIAKQGGSFIGGMYTQYTGDSETRPRNVALMFCIKY